MYCENCGKRLNEDNLYCSECGTKINRISIFDKTSNKTLWIIIGCIVGGIVLIPIIIFILTFFIIVDNVKLKEEYDKYNLKEYYDYEKLNNSYIYNNDNSDIILID